MTTKKEWTFMIYLAGNNNLSDDMIAAINGIKAGLPAINNNIAILAQYDCQHPVVPVLRYDFLENPSNPKQLENDFVSIGHSVYDFVDWCVTQQPAERYILILSGHGDGFQAKTLMMDDGVHKPLSLQELRETLEAVKVDLLKDQKLDILGFDSCVMNTIEGTYELREVADIWIGSQGFLPNSGWAFEKIVRGLANLNEIELKDSKEVAKVFVTEFIDYSKDFSFGGRSVDISACQLSEVGNIAQNVNKLSQTLISALSDSPDNSLIKQNVEQILLNAHWKSQTFFYEQTIDIRDFCENLQDECQHIQKNTKAIFADAKPTQSAMGLINQMDQIGSVCQRIVDSISIGKLLIKSAFSGADYQFSHGISLFFPWSYLSFNVSQESYGRLEFVKDVGKDWWNFLELYLELTMREPRNKSESKYDFLPKTVKPTLAFAATDHRDNPVYSKSNPSASRHGDQVKNGDQVRHGGTVKHGDQVKNGGHVRHGDDVKYGDRTKHAEETMHVGQVGDNNPNRTGGSWKHGGQVRHDSSVKHGDEVKTGGSFRNNGAILQSGQTKDNAALGTKDNAALGTKDNPDRSRQNTYQGKGVGGGEQHFRKIKNFPLNLNTSGGEG